MGNLAASGGYFISMAADKLYADAGTITGSIGIFGGKVSLQKLYEKIEMGKELYTRGKFAGMASDIRPFTDEEREKQIEHLSAFYGHFKELVSENRKMKVDSIESLAQGQVWTGKEAVANGLIDEVGGLKQALDYTAGQLNLKDYRIVFYPEKRPLFLWPNNSLISAVASIVGFGRENASVESSVSEALMGDGLFTRMLFDISIE
jgi:protease-4